MGQRYGSKGPQPKTHPLPGAGTGLRPAGGAGCDDGWVRGDPATGRSVLSGRRTTCLPRYMERTAYLATAWRLGRYYRTYPAYVQDEVEAALDDPGSQFQRGPLTLTARGTADRRHPGLRRDRPELPVRALARRRLPVRPPLLRPAGTRRPGRRLSKPQPGRAC